MSTDAPILHAVDIRPSSTIKVMGQIATQAIPQAIVACVFSMLNLGMLAILSRNGNTEAVYLMSLMQPAFFLIIAIMEGLAVTNQVYSARTKHVGPKQSILKSSRRLSWIGIALICILALVGYGASKSLELNSSSLVLTLSYLPAAALSMVPFLVFEVYYGALRGRGRGMRGIAPLILAAGLSLLVTGLLLRHYPVGFEAVLIGNFAGPLLMLPVIILLARREVGLDNAGSGAQPQARLAPLFWAVGFPVFFSIVIASASAAVLFPILDRFGKDEVSAFLVVIRLRAALMIPATAVGSAIAILANQSLGRNGDGMGGRYLAAGIPMVFALYALVTFVVSLNASAAIGFIVPGSEATLSVWSNKLLLLLLPTFFLAPCAVCIQIILEQLGDGIKVLALTILCEALTATAIIYAVYKHNPIEYICYILVVSAGFLFAVFLLRIVVVARKPEAVHAV
ncbi:MATE family efflux transporter [Sinorhizobium meliloti]|uniref:MATE family efflux transporter n=1 Tax=Rhizobium meliloti TaxID=382 RepID=UPI0004167A4B|nr:MATE family efflux transporter [Sinorhizobium meliloti]